MRQRRGFRVALWAILGVLAIGPASQAYPIPATSIRAMAVTLDKKNQGGAVVGCRVDISVTLKMDGEEPKTEVIMTGVPVLAVDEFPKGEDPEARKSTVTFQVTPEQAQRLAVAARMDMTLKVRAMEVTAKSSLVGGVLRPGNRVDVAVVTTAEGKAPSCTVVLEDLEFLGHDRTKDKQPTKATLGADAKQAEKLAEAVKVGTVHLVLRPPTKEKDDDKPTGLVAVPKDLRGVVVKCDPTTLAGGFVLPGSRADVIVTKENSDKETVAEVLVENVLILAVDTQVQKGDKDTLSNIVTVAVAREQVEKLLAGTAVGEVRFVLRAPEEKKVPLNVGNPAKSGDWRKPSNKDVPSDK